MTVYLNDKPYEAEEGTNLSGFIAQLGFKKEGIAIAIDFTVIPRVTWDNFRLKGEERLILIQAVSGG